MPDPTNPAEGAGLAWSQTAATAPSVSYAPSEPPTPSWNPSEPPPGLGGDVGPDTDALEDDEGEDGPPDFDLGEELPSEPAKPSSNAMFAIGAAAIATGILIATLSFKKR
jgi:hypothetical protein